MFRFKQFFVDQTGCAMKINTDGVLLGALAMADEPKSILDIGTGTGVIALMLAQRYRSAGIDAVEIDEVAAKTAERNFNSSPFAERLAVFPVGFEDYFMANADKRYDLIVSNPPFHLNSLTSPKAGKSLAKHTENDFFEGLLADIAGHLTQHGLCWLILPLQTGELVKSLADKNGIYLQKVITIHSFEASEPHREIVVFGKMSNKLIKDKFVIYTEPKVYSNRYKDSLKAFFTIF